MRMLLPTLILTGCLAKQAAVTAPSPWTSDLAVVLASQEDASVDPLPAELDVALAALLSARGLRPVVVPHTAFRGSFDHNRMTDQRLALLTERDGAGELLVLVETSARFDAQLGGRYRWTVHATATLLGPPGTTRVEVTVPTHLLFDHQRETDALLQAWPLIERRLARTLDAWLAGGS
jgi:hypothetical protein